MKATGPTNDYVTNLKVSIEVTQIPHLLLKVIHLHGDFDVLVNRPQLWLLDMNEDKNSGNGTD